MPEHMFITHIMFIALPPGHVADGSDALQLRHYTVEVPETLQFVQDFCKYFDKSLVGTRSGETTKPSTVVTTMDNLILPLKPHEEHFL